MGFEWLKAENISNFFKKYWLGLLFLMAVVSLLLVFLTGAVSINYKALFASIGGFLIVWVFIWLYSKPLDSEGEENPDELTRANLIRFAYLFMFVSLAVSIIPFIFTLNIDETEKARPLSVMIGCSTDTTLSKELQCDKDNPRGLWMINIAGKTKADPSGITHVDGGLVVPLYFVILALIGGAVSLTRRVPEYQKQSAPNYVGTETEPKLDIANLREKLVFQIVQFISAPFIAVVAYHLINPGEMKYSVALGFTAGFASETILLMIRALVQKVNPAGTKVIQKGAVSGLVADNAAQGLADIEVKAIGPSGLTTQTDNKGHFVIQDIPVGQHAIEATDTQGVTKIAKVEIRAGKVDICHIQFP